MDLADRRAVWRVHDQRLADTGARLERLGEKKRLRASRGAEADGHAWACVGFHEDPFICGRLRGARGRLASELKHNPVRDGLRTGVALERPEGAVDGLKRAEGAVGI